MTRARVHFVCTGNLCRSPFAETLFAGRAAAAGLEFVASSSGIHALSGRPCPPEIIEVGQVYGLDLSRHRSCPFDAKRARTMALVVAMDRYHLDFLSAVLPDGPTVRLAGEFMPGRRCPDVPDPYGRTRRSYEKSAALIAACIDGLVRSLTEGSVHANKP